MACMQKQQHLEYLPSILSMKLYLNKSSIIDIKSNVGYNLSIPVQCSMSVHEVAQRSKIELPDHAIQNEPQ